jgi:hypothetical protein
MSPRAGRLGGRRTGSTIDASQVRGAVAPLRDQVRP